MAACQSKFDAASKAALGSRPVNVDPAKLAKFSQCMRAHGVPDFPDPGTNGGIVIHGDTGGATGPAGSSASGPPGDLNPNSPAFQKAQKACGGLIGGPKLSTSAAG
jgi:hypothetical protein